MKFLIIDLVLLVGCWVIVSVGLHVSGVRDVSGRVSLTGAMLLAGQYERTELEIGIVRCPKWPVDPSFTKAGTCPLWLSTIFIQYSR